VLNGTIKPKTDADMAFKKAVACELIFAWKDGGPAAKQSLARVMNNVGLDYVNGEWMFDTPNGYVKVWA
jgi:hypothetical protein